MRSLGASEMSMFDRVENKLAKANQQHLLKFWNDLSNKEQESFLKHLDSINYIEANELFEKAIALLHVDAKKLDGLMKPIPPQQFESEERSTCERLAEYRHSGYNEISNGHVGVLLLAGGQGTRLGVSYPKGMYSPDLPSGKTLFQIQAERIRRIEELACDHTGKKGFITWYIMTSESTDKLTSTFLQKNNYFGLDSNNVVQFDQGLIPCFNLDGSIILEDKNRIALAPDGNGGMYRALRQKNILQDMRKRGVQYIHVHSVDNILVKVADPVFIGYCVSKKADCGAKVVKKASPTEAIGVVCQINDRFQVVEYSEIPDETANLRDEVGNLVFSAGSICNHFFTTDFLFKIADYHENELKLHVAKKRIPFVNDSGNKVIATDANGIKIEKFIFDVFQFSNNFVTWEVPRRCEFSALKNMDEIGIDCPSTARKDLFALYKGYVENAGGQVVGDVVEISSLLSYAGEDLECRVNGRVFTAPVFISENDCMINNGCSH